MQLLHGPADMEVHLGSDQRHYVLDTARMMVCNMYLCSGEEIKIKIEKKEPLNMGKVCCHFLMKEKQKGCTPFKCCFVHAHALKTELKLHLA